MSSYSDKWKYINIDKELYLEMETLVNEGRYPKGQWTSNANFVGYWLSTIVYFYKNDRKRLEKLRNDYDEAMQKGRINSKPEPSEEPRQSVKKEGSFFCRYCGKPNEPDAIYCEKCGKRIGTA